MNTRLDTRVLDSILARPTRRRSNRVAEFPPDFVHGDGTLDEIYEAFGEHWVHSAAFVQHHCTPDGRLVAVSVATFTDWFLTVEHLAVGDHEGLAPESMQHWVRDRLRGRRVVIELQVAPAEAPQFEGSRWIDVFCPIERLLELETSILHVHREGVVDWATTAQTNLLSLIGLCARLGVERVN